MRRFPFALLLSLAIACVSSGQTPTIDQSLSYETASTPEISPDGRFVAYSVRKADWEQNEYVSQIWLYNTATGVHLQLTRGKKSSGDPKWSPDGKWLAFTSGREEKTQLFLISPIGGEAVALTKDDNGVGSFEWAPDGTRIAYTVAPGETEKDKAFQKKYGGVEVIDHDYKLRHLWTVEIPPKLASLDTDKPKPEALTSGDAFTVSAFRWSPDGKRIAFSAAKDPNPNSAGTADIYTVRLADKAVKHLVSTPGPDSRPVFSPDGTQIAFNTSNGSEYFFYTNDEIATVPVDGGTPQVLTQGFDEDASLMEWADDGIYFNANQKTVSGIFRLNPQTGAATPLMKDPGFTVNGGSFTKDYKQFTFVGARENEFAEIYLTDVSSFQPKAITTQSDQFKDFQLASREVISWKSQDGATIEGVLLKPSGYDAAKKYPLLVIIHGGPTGIDTPYRTADRNYPMEMFAAKGALILKPNYRGSAGYGAAFRALNVRNLGVGDYWDVISGVDSLIAKGMVDKDRVGAMGWSQGGYISAFIACSSDRFKAVSVGAGISDWMTYYVNTDIHPFTRMYLHATPWEDPEIYQKTSPITYVKKAQTPTLIQHGEKDQRVPIANAYELYQALQDRNVPVRLVVYKGFGHGITKPKEQRHLMEENYRWFSKYIWGEELPEPSGDTDAGKPASDETGK